MTSLRRTWLAMLLVPGLGCTDGGGAPAPATPSPSAPSATTPATLETNHRVTSAGLACLGAAYDDGACGAELFGLDEVAADVLEIVGARADPAARAIAAPAKDVTEQFARLSALGCFGFPTAGAVDAATMKTSCPATSRLVTVSYEAWRSAAGTRSL